jgi:hypothetical protein
MHFAQTNVQIRPTVEKNDLGIPPFGNIIYKRFIEPERAVFFSQEIQT